jgi:hypothetical protein
MYRTLPIQLQQVVILLSLLWIGKSTAYIYLSWQQIGLLLLFAVMVEHFLIYLKQKSFPFFSYAALSTAIGVVLMMVSPLFYIYFIVIALTLLQKHFLQISQKHLFNPSNFALISAIILFYHDAHIVMGQLSDTLWLKIWVILLAGWILFQVDRWVIPVAFSVAYICMQMLWVVSYDPVLLLEDITDRFYAVSFIVFILFMLTDPRTTPSSYLEQFLFALFVALVSSTLDRVYGFRLQHLFMALFLLSPQAVLWQIYHTGAEKKHLLFWMGIFFLLTLSAIIFIEMHPPYYFEMDG